MKKQRKHSRRSRSAVPPPAAPPAAPTAEAVPPGAQPAGVQPGAGGAAAAGESSRSRLARWLESSLAAGVVALLVATPMTPHDTVSDTGAGIVFQLGWALLLVGWTLPPLLSPASRRLQWTAPEWLGVAVLGWIALSVLVTGPRNDLRAAINLGWRWAVLAAAYFLIRQRFAAPRAARGLAAVMIGMAALLGLLGCFQYAVSQPRRVTEWEQRSEPDKQRLLRANGIDPREDSPSRRLFVDRLYSREPLGNFSLANSLAGVLATWLVLAVGVARYLPASRTQTAQRIIWGLVLLVLATCLALTSSRTAWLAAGAGLLALVVVEWPRARWPAMGTAAGIAALAAAVSFHPAVRGFYLNAALSFRYRLEYWYSSVVMIGDHPLWGVGPGNFQDYYPQYKLPQASETIADPHNFVFELASTAGLPAALLLLAFVAGVGRVCRGRSRAAGRDAPGTGAAGTSAAGTSAASTSATSTSAASGPAASGPAAGGPATGGPEGPLGLGLSAGCGLLLAVPAGWLSGFIADPLTAEGSLPAFLAAGALGLPLVLFAAKDWIADGQFPPHLPLIAAGTLLLNLLAAGGISFLGVALSLAAAIALTLNLAVPQPQLVGRVPLALLQAALLVGAYAFLETGVKPVLQEQEVQVATGMEDAAELEASYQALAAADPVNPRPWRTLMPLAFQQWQATKAPSAWRAFEEAAQQAIRLAPQNYQTRVSAGTLYLQAARQTGAPRHRRHAVEQLRAAVERYPHASWLRVQLAVAYAADHQDQLAREQLDLAEQLDQRCPHLEQKLNRQRVTVTWEGYQQSDAEQVLRRLRRELTPEARP